MIEVELKSVVPDWEAAVSAVEAAGGQLVFAGRMRDRRFDTTPPTLEPRDHVLRLREYAGASGSRAEMTWKGPTTEGEYKRREEISVTVEGTGAVGVLLDRLGFAPTSLIERDVREYVLEGAGVRFERYARMDALVEIEGTPESMERAIARSGLPRAGFTSERLLSFVRRFQERTGTTAALFFEAPGSNATGVSDD